LFAFCFLEIVPIRKENKIVVVVNSIRQARYALTLPKSILSNTGGASILEKNIRTGQDVLENFRREVGFPNSSSYFRQVKYNKNINYYALAIPDVLDNAIEQADKDITTLRMKYLYDHGSDITKLAGIVQSLNAGNCDIQSKIIHQKLIERNINSAIVWSFIQNKDESRICRDHWFVVFGFDDISNLKQNPEHWGENAVVIDAWANIVASAVNWDKQIGEFLNFKPHEYLKPTYIYETHV